jgi:hypothetical protein
MSDPLTSVTALRRRATLEAFARAWAARDVDALLALMKIDCIYGASVGPEPGRTYGGQLTYAMASSRCLPPTQEGPAPSATSASGTTTFSGNGTIPAATVPHARSTPTAAICSSSLATRLQ